MELLFLQYNNYFNRIVKKQDSVDDYISACPDRAVWKLNVDFDPKNGVTTDQVVNWSEIWTPDYMLLVERQQRGEVVINTIISRWFILDWDRIRKEQYKAVLKRDSIVDNYDAVIDAPCYIEKATCDINDVAIYNQEPIEFNEIKKSEKTLEDRTLQAWIVGYYQTPKDDQGVEQDVTINVSVDELPTIAKVTTIDQWEYGHLVGHNYTQLEDLKFQVEIEEAGWNQVNYSYTYSNNGSSYTTYERAIDYPLAIQEQSKNSFKRYLNSNYTTLENQFYTIYTLFGKEDLKAKLDGKYIKVGNEYKKITVSTVTERHSETVTIPNDSTYGTYLHDTFLALSYITSGGGNNSWIVRKSISTVYSITLTTVSTVNASFTLSKSSNKLLDAPYKMFCMPYNGGNWMLSATDLEIGRAAPFTQNVATEVARQLGSNVYDIQLLPYCPCLEWVSEYGNILAYQLTAHDYTYIKDGNDMRIGIVLYPKQSSFTLDVNYSLTEPTTAVEKKIVNQCDKYRLCSPNYAASFDFNLIKSGSITKFNVDCTYKPYNPYVHINPVWSRLYGNDYNDCRGLIVQGDFSLPMINDQWQQYQINNKNYLNTFNREVENIEVSQKYQRFQDITGAVAGTMQGVAAGAAGGKALAGLGGAGIGAAVGGIASAAAGVTDVIINDKLREESLNLKKDMFNYSINNIKALPNTISKVSAFDYNNKMFPIIEYYSCTDEEKEIFTNLLTYSGMTINRIGTINQFKQDTISYIQGQIIRLPDFEDNVPVANDIYKEISKGVFI